MLSCPQSRIQGNLSATRSSGGFTPGEIVSYWLTAPDGTVLDGAEALAAGDGSVGFGWTAIAPTPIGYWHVAAYGQSSDRLGTVAFRVEQ